MTDERTKQDWANYRRFVHHKNALNMIFSHRPPLNERQVRTMFQAKDATRLNRDAQYDVDRAADEEGVSVADYLKGPSHDR